MKFPGEQGGIGGGLLYLDTILSEAVHNVDTVMGV